MLVEDRIDDDGDERGEEGARANFGDEDQKRARLEDGAVGCVSRYSLESLQEESRTHHPPLTSAR